ncbi:hypothetical protein CCASP_04700 [Corynebacterium caspium DSM 44850]|nr:hypothetical protein CCASP_04700 [Corynebacterium caspium DSM 44850]
MRSRYSAFVVQDESYLLRTWDPFTRPTGPLALDKSPISFYRLDILGVQGGGPLDTAGQVEFEAFYRIEIPKTSPDMTANGSANITRGSQREISTFRREDGRWFYSDGLVN